MDEAPKPGIYPNTPFETYLAWPCISQSMLKHFKRSAKHGRYMELFERDASKAQKLGDAADAALFEPKRFEEQYVVKPSFPGHPNSKLHKQAREAWEQQLRSDAVVIDQQQYKKAFEMREAILGNDKARHLLREARSFYQLSFVWIDPDTGLYCKGRCDGLSLATHPEIVGPCVWDLKTTLDPTPDGFPREVGKWGYDVQLAFYLDGLATLKPATRRPLIVAVQKEPDTNTAPIIPAEYRDVVVHELSLVTITSGRSKYRRWLRLYKACMETNMWPGSCETVNLLQLNRYDQESE